MNAAVTAPPAIAWIDVGAAEAVPRNGARIVRTAAAEVAVFRTLSDAYYAVDNRCPHRGGPLSEGIVHGSSVTCPLHNWVIDLATGKALGADEGCVSTIAVKVEAGRLFLAAAALAALGK